MRILGLDIETTGLDHDKDEITEISYALKELGCQKLLARETHFVIGKVPITDEIFRLTGITDKMRETFGIYSRNAMERLSEAVENWGVDYICAHNGDVFDRPFLLKKDHQDEVSRLSAEFLQKPWLDTTRDLPYPDNMDTRKLKYLAFEHGILNHNAHDSLSDVESMLRLFDHYYEADILKHINEPTLIIRINTGFKDKEEAKKLRYSWQQLGSEKFENCWIKRIKACDLEKEQARTTFNITTLKEERRHGS